MSRLLVVFLFIIVSRLSFYSSLSAGRLYIHHCQQVVIVFITVSRSSLYSYLSAGCHYNHHCQQQGCRKSKIGWELTKCGCHVRSLELLKKKHICLVFKLIIPTTRVFMHLFGAFRPIWLATFIFVSSFWLVNTYF